MADDESFAMSKLANFDSMWVDSDSEGKGNDPSIKDYINSDGKPSSSLGKKAKKEKTKQKPLSKIEKRKRDDERRRQSLAEKMRLKSKQLSAIKSALSESTKPKKIVFNSDDESPSPEKKDLFGDDEVGDQFEFPDGSFSPDKDGELIKLQSMLGHDDRFRIDARFLEHSSEASSNKNKNKGSLPMVRFDPTQQLEAKSEESTSKKLRKENNSDTNKTLHSSEKYYEVSDSIKESLKSKSGSFSLLAAYGAGDAPKATFERESKPKNIIKKNPLLDVSSDEECQQDEPEYDPGNAPWRPAINFPLSGSTNKFFLVENDPLFADALEFINKKNSEEAKQAAEHYSETRRVLKKIFKLQLAKRTKKASMFKKKIGGMKKKILPTKNLNFKGRKRVNKKNITG